MPGPRPRAGVTGVVALQRTRFLPRRGTPSGAALSLTAANSAGKRCRAVRKGDAGPAPINPSHLTRAISIAVCPWVLQAIPHGLIAEDRT